MKVFKNKMPQLRVYILCAQGTKICLDQKEISFTRLQIQIRIYRYYIRGVFTHVCHGAGRGGT